LLDRIQSGAVRGLICLECDPFLDHPDPGRVEAAFARLEFLAVLDSLPGQAARRADVLLPTRVPAESDGTFVNQEGRMQAFFG
jgi:NADH-quinone oxidoreductase subunit G